MSHSASSHPDVSAGETPRKGERPFHVDITHRCRSRRHLARWPTEHCHNFLSTLRLVLEVVRVEHVARLQFVVGSLRLCIPRWAHSVMETLVIIVDRHPRSAADIALSGVADILRCDGRLVTTKRLHGRPNVERSGDIFQLDPIYLYPEVLDASLNYQPGEICTGR